MCALWCSVATVAWWSGAAAPPPIVSVPISPTGGVFAEWKEAEEFGGDEELACNWWNGTHHYDPGLCSTFTVTRVSASDAARAIDRANRCAARGTTDCVLNGEIGFGVPSAFVYDHDVGMKMLVAPRFLAPDAPSEVKTIKLVDPTGEAPNQLFEFNASVHVEYLKGGARTMETAVLEGQDAYCVQALRRSIVPLCWEALD